MNNLVLPINKQHIVYCSYIFRYVCVSYHLFYEFWKPLLICKKKS